MYPPMSSVSPDGKMLRDAPLTEWKTGASFDTAKDCEAARVRVKQGSKEAIPEMRDLTEDIASALCVSTDDPRLKEK